MNDWGGRMSGRSTLQVVSIMVIALAISACSFFDVTPAKPDATGVVRIGCSMMSGGGSDEMAFCDQKAREACDGPALLLESTFGAPQADPKTGFPVAGSMRSGVARYQCTPR